MDTTSATRLGDAWSRLHTTGPEYDGYLSNHAPMVVEALARHGHDDTVPDWLTRYAPRLEDALPRGRVLRPHEQAEAIGRRDALPDWIATFETAVAARGWESVLHEWWPRLLPGLAAAATHPVIRLGHVVRTLRESAQQGGQVEGAERELATALAFWAAAHLAVPAAGVGLQQDPATALAGVVPLAQASGNLGQRLAALAAEARDDVHHQPSPEAAGPLLDDVVAAAARRYAGAVDGSPVLLVHATTAPNAVARILPSLPPELHPSSVVAAWSATTALYAAFPAPAAERPRVEASQAPDAVFAAAARHGDEHVVKLADSVLDVAERTGDHSVLDAVTTAMDRISPLS